LPLVTAGCGVVVLDPAGPAAEAIANLWWVMLATAIIVFGFVMVTLVFALRRRRLPTTNSERLGRGLVTFAGAIGPALIVLGLVVYTTYVLVHLEQPPSTPVTTIHVEGYQWWWGVHYADYGIATANEIHIPVGQSVLIRPSSGDVIHSLWVPQLQGKRDAMPDHTGQIWLQADLPGTYRGLCAEFCGLQHAKMQFLVIAHEPVEYAAWLAARQAPRPEPDDEDGLRGRQVFLESGCAACHTVSGTVAAGTLGPDLSNLASRRELGAGTLPNTRANLATWIVDAQQFKPGNRMPRMSMSDENLQDLVAYLETLR
jgi:cytochrome c oxidase subunit 2